MTVLGCSAREVDKESRTKTLKIFNVKRDSSFTQKPKGIQIQHKCCTKAVAQASGLVQVLLIRQAFKCQGLLH